MTSATRHHTKTYLRRLFDELGISPTTKLGQNFLVDPNLQYFIVEAADIEPGDVVLEVGTGTGALTALLADRAFAVVTVEVDRHLFELASEHLCDRENVTLLRQDALRNKNSMDERVLQAVRERVADAPGSFKLVANLPYNIATPVVSNLLGSDPHPASLTVTIQKELAERIVAEPKTKDYSALSVWVQCQADARIVRVLPPTVFWPRPKVDSAILRIDVDEARRASIPNRCYFRQFVKAMFLHRRKFLRANLAPAMKRHLSKSDVDEILSELGLIGNVRTEELDVPTLLKLCERTRQAAPDWRL
jgi:16S rRNA (adenine1518-N6/adenine1519-N6)-dimethyltransferase